MRVFENSYKKIDKTPCVVALGNFDGVHKGHIHMLRLAKEYAAKNGLSFGVYTFVDSPKFSGAYHSNLTTLQNRLSYLEHHVEPDFVYLEKFASVKDFSPPRFVDYLAEKFNTACTFCGDNFSFGRMASGKACDLEELMCAKGLCAKIVPTLKVDGITVSSSYIKELLQCGEVEKARKLLSKAYGFTSPVIHGAHLGHTLGFPTINQQIPHELVVPKYAVYASLVIIDGREYMGVTNFGIKPTVSSSFECPVAETYIIDFDGDVYDKHVGVYFLKMLRDEKKFSSLDELTENIKINVEQTKQFFKEQYEIN